MVVAIRLQLSMMAFVIPRSGEIPKKIQSQCNGKSDKESGNVLCAIVGSFSVWEFAVVCGVVMCDGFVLWQLVSVCFDCFQFVEVAFALLHPCVDIVEFSPKLFA